MEQIVRRVEQPPEGARGGGSGDFGFVVRASSLGGQEKLGEVWTEAGGVRRSSSWQLRCDEGRALGGGDAAPSPLMYFAAGIAF